MERHQWARGHSSHERPRYAQCTTPARLNDSPPARVADAVLCQNLVNEGRTARGNVSPFLASVLGVAQPTRSAAAQAHRNIGFPSLIDEPEEVATRPMALHEFPRQVQIDREMAVIRARHERIAKAIDLFWGHKDCVEYLQALILNGGDGAAHARVGFKLEVLSALINLAGLHEVRAN